jgi:hypothetical protein
VLCCTKSRRHLAQVLNRLSLTLLALLSGQTSKDGRPNPRSSDDSTDAPVAEGAVSLMGVRHWVIDECDKIARMGLMQDVKQLFPFLPRPPKNAEEKPMQVSFGLAFEQIHPCVSFSPDCVAETMAKKFLDATVIPIWHS